MEMYIKGTNDKDFRTSDGFFRDPFTGVKFTGNEERCDLDKGLRTPRIKDSKGNSIPIAYKLWTKEEREHFNDSKSSGNIRVSVSKKDAELRQNLLGLKEFLSKTLKGDDLDKANSMLDKIMPADPEVAKKQAKIAKLKAQLAELEG